MMNYDTNSKKYDSLIIPNCNITADQAEDLHFTSFAGDSDTESACFTDDEPSKKANGVADGPMLAITTVTEEKKDAHQMFDEMREGEKWTKYEVVKGFVSRVWKMIVGDAKDTGGGDESDAFDDLERGGV
ncbi:hypothetical protein Tco_0916539 [Tanacetum coccineum]